ncbi:hypothetical protein TNCV_862881 [Trichonephila clavipes]|nr:hypothetical protein TNCV_862881 [Trichonephila clavipes]
MNRCPDLVVCLKRDLQCLRPEASLVLIYRPNVAGMKGRVDLTQPVNRTPDLWCGSTIHYHSILFGLLCDSEQANQGTALENPIGGGVPKMKDIWTPRRYQRSLRYWSGCSVPIGRKRVWKILRAAWPQIGHAYDKTGLRIGL